MGKEMQAEEITIDVGWGRLAAKVWGPETGIPAVAIHGWLDNAGSFDRLAPLLPGVRVVAVDMAGHGHSDHRPYGTTYPILEWLPDLNHLLEAMGWKKTVFLGHSMGGAIAALYAAVFPEKIERLVLLESLGTLPLRKGEGFVERLRRHYAEGAAIALKQLPVYRTPEAAGAARVRVAPVSEEGIRCLMKRALKPVEGGFTWRSDPRLRIPTAVGFTESQVAEVFQAIQCPTLLMRASDGLFHDEILWKTRAAWLKDSREKTDPGKHHWHLDIPEVLAPPILQFLND